jgi:hypothetical protein
MTYGFMRTGLVGDVDDNVAAEEFVGRAARLLKIMGDQAWHLALAYVAHHAWRTTVTPDDARMAIRYQARHFLENMDRGIDPLVTGEYGDDDLGDDIVVDFEEEDIDVDVGDIDDDFPETETETETPTCPCEMCVAMHRATAEWASWDPDDPVERFLKDSVDAFENK